MNSRVWIEHRSRLAISLLISKRRTWLTSSHVHTRAMWLLPCKWLLEMALSRRGRPFSISMCCQFMECLFLKFYKVRQGIWGRGLDEIPSTYRKWACNSFGELSTQEALTNKAKDQDCGKKKLYPILFQKEKMRWKGNCLCLLPFAEQKENTLFASTRTPRYYQKLSVCGSQFLPE